MCETANRGSDAWTISNHVVNDLRLQYSYFGEIFCESLHSVSKRL